MAKKDSFIDIIFRVSFEEHKLLLFEVKFSSDRSTKKLKYTYDQKCGSQKSSLCFK